MGKRSLILISILACSAISFSQSKKNRVYTTDIDNFWIAYDSVQTTTDSLQQLKYIHSLYIDKGTEGLKKFMNARDYSASLWIDLIRKVPKFWTSIRPNTMLVKSYAGEIEKSIQQLKELYPDLKPATIYFTIGGLRSGGTTKGNMVLIGAEIAMGNSQTDVSEFRNKWLASVFKDQQPDNLVSLNIHEYVHTQQRGISKTLLAQSIKEGSADFVTELVMGNQLMTNYLIYGRLHEEELKIKFKDQMFTTQFKDWLYNGSDATTVADLGYYMGYAICRRYYKESPDKTAAIKNIIELNYSDGKAVEHFLNFSNYYSALNHPGNNK